jgi:hypothetical protein
MRKGRDSQGAVTERIGVALQKQLRRFDSARYLFQWGSSSVVELQVVALAMLVRFQPVPLWWCSSMDRATACEAVDGSSSLPIAFFSGGIAQWVEQQPLKLKVAGSSPAAIIILVLFDGIAQAVEQ